MNKAEIAADIIQMQQEGSRMLDSVLANGYADPLDAPQGSYPDTSTLGDPNNALPEEQTKSVMSILNKGRDAKEAAGGTLQYEEYKSPAQKSWEANLIDTSRYTYAERVKEAEKEAERLGQVHGTGDNPTMTAQDKAFDQSIKGLSGKEKLAARNAYNEAKIKNRENKLEMSNAFLGQGLRAMEGRYKKGLNDMQLAAEEQVNVITDKIVDLNKARRESAQNSGKEFAFGFNRIWSIIGTPITTLLTGVAGALDPIAGVLMGSAMAASNAGLAAGTSSDASEAIAAQWNEGKKSNTSLKGTYINPADYQNYRNFLEEQRTAVDIELKKALRQYKDSYNERSEAYKAEGKNRIDKVLKELEDERNADEDVASQEATGAPSALSLMQ